MKFTAKLFSLLVLGLLITLGTYWAFQRGGRDFDVFYTAARWVLSGEALRIYSDSPDRYLYAPGFAWIMAPLALLPRDIALAAWCLLKAAALGLLIRDLGLRLGATVFAAFGVILLARPVLIDFQYGQVNLIALCFCTLALLAHFDGQNTHWRSLWLRWGAAGFFAAAKLIPLPVLLVPWLVSRGISKSKLRHERLAGITALTFTLAIPLISVGPAGTLDLFVQWKMALLSKGLPLESHNQSFWAFLTHAFSGLPTHVIALGPNHVVLGPAWLSQQTIQWLASAWMLISTIALLAWLALWSRIPTLTWIAVLCALLILPSHLIWKPYFVFGIPVAALALQHAWRLQEDEINWPLGLIAALALLINFTGADVLGPLWHARFEAYAVLLWAHLVLISFVLWSSLRQRPNRQL